MPIAFVTSQTFPVSLAVDVEAHPDEAKRPAFRFRYLSEAQRLGFSDALNRARDAETRTELKAALLPELERYFVAAERMPDGYRGWDDLTATELLELGELVLREQDLSEVDLKKSKSPGQLSQSGSAQAVVTVAAANLPAVAAEKTAAVTSAPEAAG